MMLTLEQKAIIRTILEASGDTSDVKDLIVEVQDNDNGADFEVHHAGYDWRVINDDDINDILASELTQDEYLLGCFNPYFLAGILGTSGDVIQAFQDVEAFEALGKLIIDQGKVEEIAESYASADGYGNHFSGYDGNGHETAPIDGNYYHVFNRG